MQTWPNFGYTVAYSGGGGVITPATLSVGAGTVSRISGVAPLAVHFLSEGTTSTGTTKPFHEIEYRWDFGDTGAGNWSKGARSGLSRNTHRGPNAAHVFETPGTYTVSMIATDGTNTATTQQVTITVTDPDTVFASDTVCFSTSGDFTGAPAGALQVQTSDQATAINTYKSTKKRLLFKRGQTFTSTAAPKIDVQGPGIIGAFGTGAKPIWRRGSASYINFELGTTWFGGGAVINDWRIMDISIDGQDATDSNNVGTRATQSVTQALFLRTDLLGMYRGYDFSLSYASGASKVVHDQVAIHDCISTGVPGSLGAPYFSDWRVYAGGNRLSIQGVDGDNFNDGGSHVIRNEFLTNSVIANNTLARAGSTMHLIKIASQQWDGSGLSWLVNVYSEKNQVADNDCQGGSGGPWLLAFGPQDDGKDERVRDIVIERNHIKMGSNSAVGIICWASRSTIRNNVVNFTNSSIFPNGIVVDTRGIEPTPDDTVIFNNTITGSTDGTALTGIQVGTATNTKVKNNLLYAPGTFPFGKTALTDTGTGTVASNNSSDGQMSSTSPLFATNPPVTFANHKVTTGSYAINGGTPVPVVTDAALVALSLTTPDMGALAH